MSDKYERLLAVTIALVFVIVGIGASVGPRGETFISDRNSTSALLGADEIFTGLADNVGSYSQVICVTFSDVGSTVGGYTMELSTDGMNWDRKKALTTSGGESQSHTLVLPPEFFRIVYVNGSSPQTEFRLKCKYTRSQGKDLTSSATETISDNSDVLLVRQSGNHDLDVARGVVKGHEWVTKVAHNSSVGAVEEAVWPIGGDFTGFLTASSQLEIVSDDAGDAAAGIGARTVVIEGLDVNFDQVTEIVTMNGTTPVTTIRTDWMRVTRVFAEDVGTYSDTNPSTTGSNEGIITVRVAGGGAVMCLIEAEEGQSEVASYTVPRGRNAYLQNLLINVSSGAQKSASVRMWQRRNANDVVAPFTSRRVVHKFNELQGERAAPFNSSVPFPEMTDIWFSALRTDSQDAEVDVQFTILLVPNETLSPVP